MDKKDPLASIRQLERELEQVKLLIQRAKENTEELKNMLHDIEVVVVKLHEVSNGNSH
jgi:hypothetical protein